MIQQPTILSQVFIADASTPTIRYKAYCSLWCEYFTVLWCLYKEKVYALTRTLEGNKKSRKQSIFTAQVGQCFLKSMGIVWRKYLYRATE